MLSTEALTKRFPGASVPAVDALTLIIAPGELSPLLGPNDAGKTTTINCLLDFVQPDSRRALIDGLDVAREPLAKQAKA